MHGLSTIVVRNHERARRACEATGMPFTVEAEDLSIFRAYGEVRLPDVSSRDLPGVVHVRDIVWPNSRSLGDKLSDLIPGMSYGRITRAPGGDIIGEFREPDAPDDAQDAQGDDAPTL